MFTLRTYLAHLLILLAVFIALVALVPRLTAGLTQLLTPPTSSRLSQRVGL